MNRFDFIVDFFACKDTTNSVKNKIKSVFLFLLFPVFLPLGRKKRNPLAVAGGLFVFFYEIAY